MGLAGVRVAVTRQADQAARLMDALRGAGALPAAFPLIRTLPAEDAGALSEALRDGGFAWVVFSSANAVRYCAQAARSMNADLGACLGAARIACVGPATAEVAGDAGLTVDVLPETAIGEAIAPALALAGLARGARVLWPRSAQAREVLADALRAQGARLSSPVAYRTESDPAGAQALAAAILQNGIDLVIFASPSAVQSLRAVLPALKAVRVAAIGPVTAAAARAAGYPVDVVAPDSTVEGLVAALEGAGGR